MNILLVISALFVAAIFYFLWMHWLSHLHYLETGLIDGDNEVCAYACGLVLVILWTLYGAGRLVMWWWS
jgi:hypothetical protein